MADGSKIVDSGRPQWTQATPAGYMPGFGNDFETEALPGALPVGQNSPQRAAYGLYAEQLSGSPFTAPRGTNERSWLYRIRPSVQHAQKFRKSSLPFWKTAPCLGEHDRPIGQLRWGPVPVPKEKLTFLAGMRTMTTAGDVNTQAGMAAHVYLATQSMESDYFYNADGEMLVVPQQGAVRFCTEFGRIEAGPGEICIIPRGVKFKVELVDGPARGYVCENYGAKFTLPDRGPIGANCLANARDFNPACGCTKPWFNTAAFTTTPEFQIPNGPRFLPNIRDGNFRQVDVSLEKALATSLAASLRAVASRGRRPQLIERLERVATRPEPAGGAVVGGLAGHEQVVETRIGLERHVGSPADGVLPALGILGCHRRIINQPERRSVGSVGLTEPVVFLRIGTVII